MTKYALPSALPRSSQSISAFIDSPETAEVLSFAEVAGCPDGPDDTASLDGSLWDIASTLRSTLSRGAKLSGHENVPRPLKLRSMIAEPEADMAKVHDPQHLHGSNNQIAAIAGNGTKIFSKSLRRSEEPLVADSICRVANPSVMFMARVENFGRCGVD